MRKLTAIAITGLMFAGGCDSADKPSPRLGGGDISNATIFNQPGVFYRVEASYEYLPTGETIAFDYVASCFNKELPGSFAGSLLPAAMYKATTDGAAIGVQTMSLCGEGGVFPEGKGAPHPFTIVFPDVNDLFDGWGYANHHAYDRPNTELKFITGKITKTDRAAFMNWMETAPIGYEQIGALPGPHGHQHDVTKEQRARNNGRNFAGNSQCSGYTRVPLSDRITKYVQGIAPPKAGRYWTQWVLDADMEALEWSLDDKQAAIELVWDLRKTIPDIDGVGRPLGRYLHGPGALGTLNKDGGGG